MERRTRHPRSRTSSHPVKECTHLHTCRWYSSIVNRIEQTAGAADIGHGRRRTYEGHPDHWRGAPLPCSKGCLRMSCHDPWPGWCNLPSARPRGVRQWRLESSVQDARRLCPLALSTARNIKLNTMHTWRKQRGCPMPDEARQMNGVMMRAGREHASDTFMLIHCASYAWIAGGSLPRRLLTTSFRIEATMVCFGMRETGRHFASCIMIERQAAVGRGACSTL